MGDGGTRVCREERDRGAVEGYGEEDRRMKDDRFGKQDVTRGMLIANFPGSRT